VGKRRNRILYIKKLVLENLVFIGNAAGEAQEILLLNFSA